MEFSELINPYNFGDPIEDEELFAGRNKELEEIRYYMEQATATRKLFHIALLGKRASGKTSLLNMCEIEAIEKGFCVVRIDLDEGDADRFNLFYKIFDSLLLAVCESGLYGGTQGVVYDQYLMMMAAHEVPQDKINCPFLFPIQYARSMASNASNAQVSDNSFRRDLKTIQNELQSPILLLFDEANILSLDKVNLQKIRNIFSGLTGYMLILAGTSDLFDVINTVYSPIARQFKKIYIQEFAKLKDTRQCVNKPLEFVNLPPEIIFDGQQPYQEIHEITGGSPYEIQLICHFIFRRMQVLGTSKMALSVDVLEEVRYELETSANVSNRPVINFVTKMSLRELEGLRIICQNNTRYTLQQCWQMEFILNGKNTSWSYAELQAFTKELQSNNIISLQGNGIILFKGDDFERIYLKYFAREKGIPLKIGAPDTNNSQHHEPIALIEHFSREDGISPIQATIHYNNSNSDVRISEASSPDIFEETIARIMNNELTVVNLFEDYDKKNDEVIEYLYDKVAINKQHIGLVKVEFSFPTKVTLITEVAELSSKPNHFISQLHEMKVRASTVDTQMSWEQYEIALPEFEKLVSIILSQDELRSKIASLHIDKAQVAYLARLYKEQLDESTDTISQYYDAQMDMFPMCHNG